MTDFLKELDDSTAFILDVKDGPSLHISNIAMKTGGSKFLAAMGENPSVDMVRTAIRNFANDGGIDYINHTIRYLGFNVDDAALTDDKIILLG
jgi:hypothetical protein